jgi:hypothetical protein
MERYRKAAWRIRLVVSIVGAALPFVVTVVLA